MNSKFFKVVCVTVVMLSLVTAASAQSFMHLKFGSFNPKGAKAGMIFGLTSGKQVDDRLDFGLSADLFIRKFTRESTVEDATTPGGTSTEEVQKEIDYQMWALPIMAQLTLHLMPDAVVQPYISIAGGYEIVFSKEANYETGDKDNRFYGGFGWQLIAGGAYPLGTSSAITGEILYNGATVKRSKGKDDLGFPIHEELDFSGFGFRLGLRLDWL